METLLLNIVKEANGQKLATIRKAAQDAHGKYLNLFRPDAIRSQLVSS